MIADLDDYIEAHISQEPPELKKIDRLTNLRYLNGRMCSGHVQGRLLKMLVAMACPKRVIELGTFTGYSALCIAEALAEDASLETVEIDDEMEQVILDNIHMSPHGNKVHLHIGDASEVMKQWSDGEFDMAFMDADKRKYTDYFHELMRLIKPGGFIVADNTLWDGHVAESGKHSSQTLGIMAFNDYIAKCRDVEVAIIPVRDGITIIRKK